MECRTTVQYHEFGILDDIAAWIVMLFPAQAQDSQCCLFPYVRIRIGVRKLYLSRRKLLISETFYIYIYF